MLNVFIFVMVLFTSQGPGGVSTIVGDQDTCERMIVQSQNLIGQKIKGPTGDEKVLVLDAQAKCVPFTQHQKA